MAQAEAEAEANAETGIEIEAERRSSLEQASREQLRGQAPLAFAAAIVATLFGIILVWAARQAWMLSHPRDYYSLPVHMFPPAAVGLAFLLARVASAAVLAAGRGRTGTGAANEAPLLGETK